MLKFFISYRRQDSIDVTGRIREHLDRHFGADCVFMDVDSIPPGADFRTHLHDAVSECDVLLAVIGTDWLGAADESGNRRLDDPGDFVRLEIEAALGRGIPIMPVLVRGASMPRPAQLPPSLEALAFRNAMLVRPDPDFRHDVERLIRALERSTAGATTGRESGAAPASPRPGRIINNSIGMKLVLIPAGEFLMGSPDSERSAHANEKPQHRVRITKPCYLGVEPVTQTEYQLVVGNNPSHFKGDRCRPVETVSWEDAAEFCRRLSGREGQAYRLPTEAQWEYACRAGSTTWYYFGEDHLRLCQYAWYEENSNHTTHPVGEKEPNAWGLYDMHGNVWEWCADYWNDQYYLTSPTNDPAGPSSGSSRVSRGGSSFYDAWSCRCAKRDHFEPAFRNNNLGFRVCCVAPETTAMPKVSSPGPA